MNHLEWPAGDSSWLHIWIFDSSMNTILAEGNLTTVLRDHFSPLIFKLYRHNMSTADQFLSWGSLNFLSWHLCLCLCGSVCMHVCVFVGSSWEGWTSRSPRSTRRAGEWGQISQEFIKGHQWPHTHTHTRICFLPTFFCDCRDSKGRRDLQDQWGLLDHRWAQQYGSVLLWNTSPALWFMSVFVWLTQSLTC